MDGEARSRETRAGHSRNPLRSVDCLEPRKVRCFRELRLLSYFRLAPVRLQLTMVRDSSLSSSFKYASESSVKCPWRVNSLRFSSPCNSLIASSSSSPPQLKRFQASQCFNMYDAIARQPAAMQYELVQSVHIGEGAKRIVSEPVSQVAVICKNQRSEMWQIFQALEVIIRNGVSTALAFQVLKVLHLPKVAPSRRTELTIKNECPDARNAREASNISISAVPESRVAQISSTLIRRYFFQAKPSSEVQPLLIRERVRVDCLLRIAIRTMCILRAKTHVRDRNCARHSQQREYAEVPFVVTLGHAIASLQLCIPNPNVISE